MYVLCRINLCLTLKHLCFQTNGHGSAAGDLVYQERLSRLESDKECLVLQVCCRETFWFMWDFVVGFEVAHCYFPIGSRSEYGHFGF